MAKAESIQEFHQKSYPSCTLTSPFNVFETRQYACSPMPYSRRDFYKISLLTGQSRLIYADKGIEIDRPALVFSNPLVPYSFEGISEIQGGYFCLFTEQFIKANDRDPALCESPLFKIGKDPVYFVNPQQQDFITAIFQNMQREFSTDYIHKYDLIKNYISLILHEAMKMQPSANYFKHQNAAARITASFLELLNRQFPIDSPQHALSLKTAAQYAENLSVHVNHLNNAVKEVTGKTTTELITNRIIEEAKALLKHTTWSVSEIAFSLGFEYPTYFNNLFKKQTGMTPRAIRQTL
jgi:AraC family transcriptional activator of pobA